MAVSTQCVCMGALSRRWVGLTLIQYGMAEHTSAGNNKIMNNYVLLTDVDVKKRQNRVQI